MPFSIKKVETDAEISSAPSNAVKIISRTQKKKNNKRAMKNNPLTTEKRCLLLCVMGRIAVLSTLVTGTLPSRFSKESLGLSKINHLKRSYARHKTIMPA